MSTVTFNPIWMPVVLVLSTGIVSGSVSIALNSHESQENREFREYQRGWNTNMEAKFSDQRNLTDKTLVGLQKDVETANKTLASIQQAMMGRPIPSLNQNTP